MNDTEPLEDLTSIQRTILVAVRMLTQEHRYPPSVREVAQHLGRKSPGGLAYQYRELEAKGYMRCEPGRPRTVEVRLPGEPPFPAERGGSPPPPEGIQPESAQPEAPQPEAPQPEAPQPEAPQPEAAQPEVTQPEAPQPEAAQPEAVQADAAEIPDPDKVTWVPVAGRISAGSPILAEQAAIEDYLPLPTEVVGREEGVFILEVQGDSMIGAGIFPGDWVVIRPLFQPPQNNDIVAATIDGVELEGTIKTYKKVGGDVWLMPHNPAHTPIPGGKAKFAGKVVAVLRQV